MGNPTGESEISIKEGTVYDANGNKLPQIDPNYKPWEDIVR